MDDCEHLSTVQAARALGVGVSTVKRWVDDGVLAAHKTPGGHRKLLLADVLRFAQEGNFPNLDTSRLLRQRNQKAVPPAILAEDLCAALLRGKDSQVRALVQRAYRGGMALADLADLVISPAMRRVGHQWETGTIDVLHEHVGTQLCAGALYELKAQLESASRPDRPVAVGGATEDDPYSQSSLLIEMVLLEAGWAPINLGANTPLGSFQQAIKEFSPRLMWLSINYLADLNRFQREYAALYRVARQGGVAVVLGGQALTPALRATLPHTWIGDSVAQLAAFARTLHPAPGRPRRGRPQRMP